MYLILSMQWISLWLAVTVVNYICSEREPGMATVCGQGRSIILLWTVRGTNWPGLVNTLWGSTFS